MIQKIVMSFLMIFLVPGCDDKAEYDRAIEICKDKGGLKYLTVYRGLSDHMECMNGFRFSGDL